VSAFSITELHKAGEFLLTLINAARKDPAGTAQTLTQRVNALGRNTFLFPPQSIDLNEGLPANTITADPKQPLVPNPTLRAEVDAYLTNFLLPHVTDNPLPNGWPHFLDGAPQDRVQRVFSLSPGHFVEENIGETPPYSGARHVTTTAQLEQEVTRIFLYLFWDVQSDPQGRGHRRAFLNPDSQEVGSSVIVGPFGNSDVVLTTNDFVVHPS
jgi:hypothetical protein